MGELLRLEGGRWVSRYTLREMVGWVSCYTLREVGR